MLAGTGFQCDGTQYVHDTRLMSISVAVFNMADAWVLFHGRDSIFSHVFRRDTMSVLIDERRSRGSGGSSGCERGQDWGVWMVRSLRPRVLFIYRSSVSSMITSNRPDVTHNLSLDGLLESGRHRHLLLLGFLIVDQRNGSS